MSQAKSGTEWNRWRCAAAHAAAPHLLHHKLLSMRQGVFQKVQDDPGILYQSLRQVYVHSSQAEYAERYTVVLLGLWGEQGALDSLRSFSSAMPHSGN